MERLQEIKESERLALGIAEAAATIGCSPGHIRNLIERGQLRSVKAGRRRLVTTQALLEYLNDDSDEGSTFGANSSEEAA